MAKATKKTKAQQTKKNTTGAPVVQAQSTKQGGKQVALIRAVAAIKDNAKGKDKDNTEAVTEANTEA